MKVIELNRPALSSRLNVKEISCKPYVSHMMYMNKSKVVQQASLEAPVFRICKDYEADNITFSLNLLTDKTDMGKVEKFMDKVANSLTREEVLRMLQSNRPFVYLDNYYGARS